MNAVFTIVAKNYLPLAFLQADTCKKYNPDIKHFILIADLAEGIILPSDTYNIDELDVLDIPQIDSLEFKYNVTEFCTAVKPFYILHLFNKGFDKVVYLDPDVCVFASLNTIFYELNSKSIVLTPHLITPELTYTGTATEQLLLHAGVFNLGFVAVKGDESGRHFAKWWANRLYHMCYQDKIEALHTDQKWIDLAASFYHKDLFVSDDIGRNMAFWNLHERKLILNEDKTFTVENRFNGHIAKLMLFHFAGYDINNAFNVIHKNHLEYTMDDFPELRPLFNWYKEELLKAQFDKYIKLKYSFNFFENGDIITHFQRRLYRRLIEKGIVFEKPFSVSEGSFYSFLRKNKLLASNSLDSLKSKDIDAFQTKIFKLNILMIFLKNILGFDRYSLLLKFCARYLRPENQTFLIREFRDKYQFINENVKIRK